MYWNNWTIGTMKRESSFRFRVSGLHYCRHHMLPEHHGPFRNPIFEICIRLDSDSKWCEDTINGERLHIPYPHVAWKLPGEETIIRSSRQRDNIAFHYTPEIMEEFFRIGMKPACNANTIVMNEPLTRLIADLRKLISNLYSPGAPDRIDWVCFQLYKTLLEIPLPEENTSSGSETIIRNISMWLQTHYDEPVDICALARDHGMSHAKFYVEWRKVFPISPVQYVLEKRLETASHFLRYTDLSIEKIIREIHFSNAYTFHKRFRAKFGMTPAQYRMEQEEKKTGETDS